MKRVLVLLVAGTIVSGVAAAYASYAGTLKRGEARPQPAGNAGPSGDRDDRR